MEQRTMYKSFVLLLVSIMLYGCGSDRNAQQAEKAKSNALSTASEPDSPPTPKRGKPKWEILIDGMPPLSGNVITGATMAGFGNYALASSDASISISLENGNPTGSIIVKYTGVNIRCANFGKAQTVVDGDRAVLTGDVGCFPADGNPDDQQPSAITGWFEIKK
jgi:hypothetical protein